MCNGDGVGTPDVTADVWKQEGRAKEYFLKGCLPALHNHDRWPGYRSLFQVNRDQILYSDFLMRLAGKAQILIGQRDVMVRSRLTHTLEVVQIARQLVAEINETNGAQLNEHLCEAIALGHDLGHPPFAHMGEKALNACLIELALRRAIGVDTTPEDIQKRDVPTQTSIRHEQYICQLLAHWELMKADPRLAAECVAALGEKENRTLIDFFADRGFVRRHNDERRPWDFEPWGRWQVEDEMRSVWNRHFLLQDEHTRVFDHYRHGMRVLVHLCPTQDFSPELVYGVGTHSGTFSPHHMEHYRVNDSNYSVDFATSWWDPASHMVRPAPHQAPLTCRLTGEYATHELGVVRAADDIAWLVSDYGDAKNRLFWQDEIERMGLVDEQERVGAPQRWRMALTQCSDVIDHVRATIGEGMGNRAGDIKIGFSDTMQKYRDDYLKKLATPLIYDRIARKDSASLRMVRDLFWFYYDTLRMGQALTWPKILREFPGCLLPECLSGIYADALYSGYRDSYQERLVADIIATFTDQEAIAAHSAVFTPEFQPHEHPVFSPPRESPRQR